MGSNEQYIPDDYGEYNIILFATFMSLTLFTGIVANIVAVIATRYAIKIYGTSNRRRKITIPTFLIHCLMAVDLFTVLFFFFRGVFLRLYTMESFRCDLEFASSLLLSWLAGLINALMCFERCVAMTAPFYYHKNASLGKAKIGVVIVIIIAFVFSMLPVFGFGSYKIDINGTYHCIGPGDIGNNVTAYDLHYTVLYLISGIGLVLFIQICNAIVISKIMAIHKRARTMRNFVTSHTKGRVDSSTTHDSQASTNTKSSNVFRTLFRALATNMTNGDTTSSTNSTSDNRGGHDAENEIRSGRRQRKQTDQPGKNEINIARRIVVVSVVFTLSWLPFYVSANKRSAS